MPEIFQMPPAKSAAAWRIEFAYFPYSLGLGFKYGSSVSATGVFMMSRAWLQLQDSLFCLCEFDTSINNTALCSSASSLCSQGLSLHQQPNLH